MVKRGVKKHSLSNLLSENENDLTNKVRAIRDKVRARVRNSEKEQKYKDDFDAEEFVKPDKRVTEKRKTVSHKSDTDSDSDSNSEAEPAPIPTKPLEPVKIDPTVLDRKNVIKRSIAHELTQGSLAFTKAVLEYFKLDSVRTDMSFSWTMTPEDFVVFIHGVFAAIPDDHPMKVTYATECASMSDEEQKQYAKSNPFPNFGHCVVFTGVQTTNDAETWLKYMAAVCLDHKVSNAIPVIVKYSIAEFLVAQYDQQQKMSIAEFTNKFSAPWKMC